MLILTRKRNESIKIGNDILIKVVQTKNGLVKLGIEAPSNIRILRSELVEFAAATNDPSSEAHLGEDHATAPLVADCDCYLAFSTEYAAEIEDQMLCVATD